MKEEQKETECPAIPRFVPETDKGCKGHANRMLDCEYTHQIERDQIIKCISNYIK